MSENKKEDIDTTSGDIKEDSHTGDEVGEILQQPEKGTENIEKQPSNVAKPTPEKSISAESKNDASDKTDNTEPNSSPVIMTSENEISSKEKREILSELDKTLMELLEVVDKVQPVDESRLPSDSEVEQP